VSVCETLVIQHAMRMRQIVVCGLPRCAIIFHIISITARFSKKKKLLKAKRVFWFPLQLLSVKFLIIGRIERDTIRSVYWSSCKVPFILVRFQWNLNFVKRFSKNTQIVNFMKLCLVVPRGQINARMDGRTGQDRLDEAISRSSKFYERTENNLD
jgi:hypothetical protein